MRNAAHRVTAERVILKSEEDAGEVLGLAEDPAAAGRNSCFRGTRRPPSAIERPGYTEEAETVVATVFAQTSITRGFAKMSKKRSVKNPCTYVCGGFKLSARHLLHYLYGRIAPSFAPLRRSYGGQAVSNFAS